jgi:hypothetical protein
MVLQGTTNDNPMFAKAVNENRNDWGDVLDAIVTQWNGPVHSL